MKRYISIFFPYLLTDWFVRRSPELKDVPFVLAAPERGRMIVKAVSMLAQQKGIHVDMVLADGRAVLPTLQVFDYQHDATERVLKALGEWCIRFTPVTATDMPDGLVLDTSGCAHLWGGEQGYAKEIYMRLTAFGYTVRMSVADTIAAAWALARFGPKVSIVAPGKQLDSLLPLPPAALRLDSGRLDRMQKLGLHNIEAVIRIPRSALRRRFGPELLNRLDQALGQALETLDPITPIEPYQERLPSLEPIRTRPGIEIAVERLLAALCRRLDKEQLGVRTVLLRCYRVDSHIQQIEIGTSKPSRNAAHLFKLFSLKLGDLAPALGFELFLLDAKTVEPLTAEQEQLWDSAGYHDEAEIAELMDRITGKIGQGTVHRYLPADHYWPERAYKEATLDEKPSAEWRTGLPRPLCLLTVPEQIQVTVPLPDYPPMLFQNKSDLHQVKRADGPERIEQEWWLSQGEYRDYYCVEDEQGQRYWLYRSGDYQNGEQKWYLHGLFD
jgi:protein ImuB